MVVFADAINDAGVVGTTNFNSTVQNSANIGDSLIQPEIGWKRYDDSSSGLKYDGSNLSDTCAVTVTDTVVNDVILNIESEKSKIKLNETVTAKLAIDNITNIAAEDIRIKYDAEKLQFIDFKEVDGIKLVKNDMKAGELRFILASKGSTNVVNAKKVLLQLNFKGIKVGEALVDIVKGRVSDGIETEKDFNIILVLYEQL